jgi:hypothetical protein
MSQDFSHRLCFAGSLSLSLSRPHLNLTKIQILKSGDEIKEIREREARNNLKEKKERGERREV